MSQGYTSYELLLVPQAGDATGFVMNSDDNKRFPVEL